jgi:serine/threonine-protein kinase
MTSTADPLDTLRSALADRYTIERELGAGGMATVYLAEDVKHRRKVAIKVLHAELSAILGPERFLKEIELTANLQHPHILPLFDSGSAAGLLYYVMPYVDGETLRTRLAREKQLSVGDAVRIACEAADALEYAHGRGVVHRDIKPENILLQNGHALVADFGIALAVQQAGGQRMTQTGLSLGTPQYMSPEQAMGEREIGPRSDIYSLGAVTYEMLVGEPPFTGPSAQAIVAKVMTSVPVPPRELRKTIPPAAEDAVLTALEKLPADRFASAAEFARALSDTTSTSSRTGAHSRTGRSANAQHRATVLLAAIAFIASAAAAWGWLRPHHGESSMLSSPPWRVTLSLPDTAMPVGSLALSPDGSELAYAAAGARGTRIWIRRGAALEPTPLKGTEGGQGPVFSPDGRRVAFSRNGIYVVNVDGTGLAAVDDTTGLILPIAWSDDDHLLVTSLRGLARMAVAGGGLEILARTDSGEFVTNPSELPDGHGVLFTLIPRDYADMSHYRIAIADGRTTGSRVLMQGILARYVPGHLLVVRADGSLIALPFDVAAGRFTGAGQTVATGLSIETYGVVPFDVAPNGRMIYVTGAAGGELRDLVRVSSAGAVTPIDTTWVRDFESVAASRDGARVAAGIVSTTGEEIEIRDLRSGALSHYALPGFECRDPIFNSEGSLLYFTTLSSTGSGGVYQVDPGSTTAPQLVFQLRGHLLGALALTPGAGKMLYTRYGASEVAHTFAHTLAAPSTPDVAIQATAAAAEAAPAVSPDGRWLAYVSNESGTDQVYVRPMDSSRGGRWQVSLHGPGLPRWSHDGRKLFYLTADSMMVAEIAPGDQFTLGKQHGLFAASGFSSGEVPFDVLPGGAFLMIRRHVSQQDSRQVVMLERWDAGLTSGNRTQ